MPYTVAFGMYAVWGVIQNHRLYDVEEIVVDFFSFSFVKHSWFVIWIFFMYIAIYTIYSQKEFYKRPDLTICIIITVIAIWGYFNGYQHNIKYILSVAVGVAVACNDRWFIEKMRGSHSLMGWTLIILSVILMEIEAILCRVVGLNSCYNIDNILFSVVFPLALVYWGFNYSMGNNKILQFLGKYSYYIYLMHGLAVDWVLVFVEKYKVKRTGLNDLFLQIIVFFVTVLLSVLIYSFVHLIEKGMLKK